MCNSVIVWFPEVSDHTMEVFMKLQEANTKTRNAVERCWRMLDIGGLILDRNCFEHDFRAAASFLENEVGAAKDWREVLPYIVSWYIVRGYSIKDFISETADGMLLSVRRPGFGQDEAGIAMIGKADTSWATRVQPHTGDFCDHWVLSKDFYGTGSATRPPRSFDALVIVHFLTALFVLAYVDEYFWTIMNVPEFKDAFIKAATAATGLSWHSILEMSDGWSKVKAA